MGQMTTEEYQKIREGVERRRTEKFEAWAAEILAEPEANPFATVDDFMALLGSLPPLEDRPAGPEGNPNR
jgi:hypothetical protein